MYTFLDVFSRLGSIWFFLWILFCTVLPFFILDFLKRLAQLISKKYRCSYRDGLNEIANKTFTQLVKIQKLQAQSPDEWSFIDNEQLSAID